MRHDLNDFEWSVIEPLLPKDRQGRKPRYIGCVLDAAPLPLWQAILHRL